MHINQLLKCLSLVGHALDKLMNYTLNINEEYNIIPLVYPRHNFFAQFATLDLPFVKQ